MSKIKVNISFLVKIVFIIFSLQVIAFPKTKVVVPKNSNSSVTINISGKKLKYFNISSEAATILAIRGPGKLKVITREHLNTKNKKPLNYLLYYRINGGNKIKVEFNNINADKNAFIDIGSEGYASVGENIIVELSRGENTVEIWSGSENPKIYIRSLFTEIREKKIDWVRLSPMYPNDPVSLVTNEDVLSYFRYSSGNSLKIKITGPTVLRILNRVEFDYKMKGKLSYRIEVKEDKKIKNTYMLCSDRSDVTRYKKNGKMIPGKANEIVINVPSGTHKYELVPLDSYTFLAKILFPRKDINLDER